MSVPSRIVLQGIEGAAHEDEIEGLELVSSARGELIVRDVRGVRARRRFGFVMSRVTGRFVGGARFVVVSTADDGGRRGFANPRDPFGMSSGTLVRWDVTTDEVATLAPAPDANPTLCRSGAQTIALRDGQLVSIGAETFVPSGAQAEELAERDGACFVRRGSDWLLVSADASGTIATSAAEAPPAAPRAEAASVVGPYVEQIEWMGLAPSADVVGVGSRLRMYVLSAEGVRALTPPSQDCAWRSNGMLACGRVLVPTDVTTLPGPSLVEPRVRSVVDADAWTIPTLMAYGTWQREATEAIAAGTPVPPFPIQPVCASEAPHACVRAHLVGTSVDGWELFDPSTPDVVRARLPSTFPPGPGYVRVAPGGRYVRDTTRGVAIHATDASDATARGVVVGEGSWTEITNGWAELPSGWVVVDPVDRRVLRALRNVGPAIERTFEAALDRVDIVDDGHVFLRVPRDTGDEGHVIDVATLETTRVIALGVANEDRVLQCRGEALTHADGSGAPGACPIAIGDAETGRVTISSSGAFWLDARRIDQVVIHRTRDGATLTITLLTDGMLAATADGAFEIEGSTDVASLGRVEADAWDTGPLTAAGTEHDGVVRAFFAAGR